MAKKKTVEDVIAQLAAVGGSVTASDLAESLGLDLSKIIKSKTLILKDSTAFSDAEKIEVFEKIYKFAREDMDYLISHRRHIKDIDHYAYEEIMKDVFGQDIFKLINELNEGP